MRQSICVEVEYRSAARRDVLVLDLIRLHFEIGVTVPLELSNTGAPGACALNAEDFERAYLEGLF